MTTYYNIHTLISHPSSMMNRDDSGLQKTALFGGTTRTRISSQCLKRAIRNSDIYRKSVNEVSVRTNKVDELIALCKQHMADVDESLIVQVVENLGSKIKKDKNKETGITTRQFDAVQPYSIGAIRELVAMVEGGLDIKDIKKTPMIPTLDVCLSGRMDASATERNVEAAMSVAHSLTTHTADIETDWFTACDDLLEQGSGHIGTNEFSSGVFYRYAAINMDLLAQNTGKTETELASTIAMLLKCFAQVTPPAKEKTFAAHAHAECVMLSKSKQPLSLANAFRKGIENNGQVMEQSIQAMASHYEDLIASYELDDQVMGLDLTRTATNTKAIQWVETLSDIQL